jgi:uncharacterized protein
MTKTHTLTVGQTFAGSTKKIAGLIPEGLLAHHLIALGKTRSGKSSKLRILVEYLLEQHRPVCILDVKGDWWGLRYAADGKGQGFPIVIFGGKHADVPITDQDGAVVAELACSGQFPTLVDLRSFSQGARTRFFIDFAQFIFNSDRGLHLVIPEVHNFAQKGKVFSPQAGESLYWANRLASEGGGLGITILADSQRPQKVHNDFLTCCETLIACKAITKWDRDASKDWIDGAADPAHGKELLITLAEMPKPDAWVWCPEEKFGPVRLSFPMFSTFDSFRPPTSYASVKLTEWKIPDIDAIRARMAPPAPAKGKVIDTAKVVDLAKYNDLLGKHNILKDDYDALRDAYEVLLRDRDGYIVSMAKSHEIMLDDVRAVLQRAGLLEGVLNSLLQPKAEGASNEAAPVGVSREGKVVIKATDLVHVGSVRLGSTPATRNLNDKPEEGVSKGEQNILNALAWWAACGIVGPYERQRVAFAAGYSPTSGGFGELLAQMKRKNLVEFPEAGKVSMTTEGAGYAESPATPTTERALHDLVFQKLGAGEEKLLRILVNAYPDRLHRKELATLAGYSHTSGGYGELIANLGSLKLITMPAAGAVRAADTLFMRRG